MVLGISSACMLLVYRNNHQKRDSNDQPINAIALHWCLLICSSTHLAGQYRSLHNDCLILDLSNWSAPGLQKLQKKLKLDQRQKEVS